MTEPDIRPRTDDDEVAVHHPVLRQMVEAARAQPTPVLGFDAEALHVAWRARAGRDSAIPTGDASALDVATGSSSETPRRRWPWVAGLAVAAAVLLTLGWLGRGTPSPAESPTDDIAARGSSAEDVRGGPTHDASRTGPVAPGTAVLADTILATALDPETDGVPEVLGSHRLRLPEGRWSVDSTDATPVTVVVPDGALELRGGSIHVEVAGDVSRVDVLRASVEHIDAQGHRRPLPLGASAGADASDPAALARAAERYMTAGDRDHAIQTLRRLVEQHPDSSAARLGLVDLARLLLAAGQTDDARCAYALFLERWPGDALAGDVTRARRSLGRGPACEGLQPQP